MFGLGALFTTREYHPGVLQQEVGGHVCLPRNPWHVSLSDSQVAKIGKMFSEVVIRYMGGERHKSRQRYLRIFFPLTFKQRYS